MTQQRLTRALAIAFVIFLVAATALLLGGNTMGFAVLTGVFTLIGAVTMSLMNVLHIKARAQARNL